MKYFIKFCHISIYIIFFIFVKDSFSQTMYINELISVGLRAGKGNSYKIIGTIKSGEKLQIIEQNENWSRVRISSNNKEGWVQTRLLTEEEPASAILERFKKTNENFTSQNELLVEENKNFKEQNKNCLSQLSEIQINLKKINSDYETLKSESTNVLTLKANYDKAAKSLSEVTKKSEELDSQLKDAVSTSSLKWFLSGAGAILIGIYIGRKSGSGHKKHSILD